MEKLELGFVNVDHLLNQIHMLYDEENGASIIELVLKMIMKFSNYLTMNTYHATYVLLNFWVKCMQMGCVT